MHFISSIKTFKNANGHFQQTRQCRYFKLWYVVYIYGRRTALHANATAFQTVLIALAYNYTIRRRSNFVIICVTPWHRQTVKPNSQLVSATRWARCLFFFYLATFYATNSAVVLSLSHSFDRVSFDGANANGSNQYCRPETLEIHLLLTFSVFDFMTSCFFLPADFAVVEGGVWARAATAITTNAKA